MVTMLDDKGQASALIDLNVLNPSASSTIQVTQNQSLFVIQSAALRVMLDCGVTAVGMALGGDVAVFAVQVCMWECWMGRVRATRVWFGWGKVVKGCVGLCVCVRGVGG